MSAETESIVLGVIALFAAVGTAVAIRRNTAKAAAACCIVGGGVLVLYANLHNDAKREAERQAQWRERHEQWRASDPNHPPDDPQMVVLPDGRIVRPNALNPEANGEGRNFGGDSVRREMRPLPSTLGVEGFRQRVPEGRRRPMSGLVAPGGQTPAELQTPQSDRP
jgi:hypothetical protein